MSTSDTEASSFNRDGQKFGAASSKERGNS